MGLVEETIEILLHILRLEIGYNISFALDQADRQAHLLDVR